MRDISYTAAAKHKELVLI